jgi:hypothetical protein
LRIVLTKLIKKSRFYEEKRLLDMIVILSLT